MIHEKEIDRQAALLIQLSCPYIHTTDTSTEQRKWILGLSDGTNEDRTKVLTWVLKQIHPSLSLNLGDGLQQIGVCSSKESAKSFTSGTMQADQQLPLWKHLLAFLESTSEEIGSTEEFQDCINSQIAFLDKVCEVSSLPRLLDAPYSPASYRFQKKLAKQPQLQYQLSKEVLETLRKKGEDEKGLLLAEVENLGRLSAFLPDGGRGSLKSETDAASETSGAHEQKVDSESGDRSVQSVEAIAWDQTIRVSDNLSVSTTEKTASTTVVSEQSTQSTSSANIFEDFHVQAKEMARRLPALNALFTAEFQPLLRQTQQEVEDSTNGDKGPTVRRSFPTVAPVPTDRLGLTLSRLAGEMNEARAQLDRLSGIVAGVESLSETRARLSELRCCADGLIPGHDSIVTESNAPAADGLGGKDAKSTPGAM